MKLNLYVLCLLFSANLDKIWREASFLPEDGHMRGILSLISSLHLRSALVNRV